MNMTKFFAKYLSYYLPVARLFRFVTSPLTDEDEEAVLGTWLDGYAQRREEEGGFMTEDELKEESEFLTTDIPCKLADVADPIAEIESAQRGDLHHVFHSSITQMTLEDIVHNKDLASLPDGEPEDCPPEGDALPTQKTPKKAKTHPGGAQTTQKRGQSGSTSKACSKNRHGHFAVTPLPCK